jgi:hypothetical protein
MTVSEEDIIIAFEALKSRRTPPDDTKNYPYRLVPFADLRPGTKSSYLVDGVIPHSGLVAVWGPPKCGKSFWTFDLVMHIALNRPYRGRRVNGGVVAPVAYLAFEGTAGYGARAEAFRRTHEVPGDVPFFLLASNAKLVRDHEALIESIGGQTGYLPPVCVVLDTLNRSIDGSENKDEDMGAYLAAAEAIVEAFDCAVIIVHHCGIDGSRPRGHSSLTGAVDAQLSVKRDAAGHITTEVEWMKDGVEGAVFTSALKVVEVGTDDDGQPITSCAIMPVEGVTPTAAKAAKRAVKIPKNAMLALNALRDAVADLGQRVTSGHIPASVNAVTLAQWREYAYRHGLGGEEAKGRQKAFARAAEVLAGSGLVGIWDPYCWPVG